MIRTQSIARLLLLIQLATRAVAAEPVSTRIERIESGLRPAIILEGGAAEQCSLEDRMRFYKTPGVSVAVINNGVIEWARGYGVREAGTTKAVTTETLFQAASISKPVAAMVALRLVEQGRLDLDEDINRRLLSWKLPENEFTAANKASVRLLLSHRAGLVDKAGFREAAADRPLPTLREILETGKWTPAPIRVGIQPSSRFVYSGGGYCLMEQLLEDVSGKPFPALARELVLEPLHMTNSSFEQPLSAERAGEAASGHTLFGQRLPQGWNIYPATSAAGLWTTPTDLARFAIELQSSKAGRSNVVLSQPMAIEMLTTQGSRDDRDSKAIALMESFPEQPPPSLGLGVGLIGRPPMRFFHTGANPGYQCEMQAFLNTGQGAVVMTCGQQGWRLGREILCAIAKEYEWQSYDHQPEVRRAAQLASDEPERFVGRYRLAFSRPSRWVLSVTREGDQMFAQISDQPHKVALYPQASDQCFTIEDAMTLTFLKNGTGTFVEVVSDLGWRAKRETDP